MLAFHFVKIDWLVINDFNMNPKEYFKVNRVSFVIFKDIFVSDSHEQASQPVVVVLGR